MISVDTLVANSGPTQWDFQVFANKQQCLEEGWIHPMSCHFKTLTSRAELSFSRLITICHPGEDNLFRLPRIIGKEILKEVGGIMFQNDFRLKILPGIESKIFMGSRSLRVSRGAVPPFFRRRFLNSHFAEILGVPALVQKVVR